MCKNELLLKPKIDVVFHALFREQNHELLESMLSSILNTKVKIVEYLDRHLNIEQAKEKLGVMDLRVRFEDGTYCTIEIQLKEYTNENERFVYYLADAYSRQLERGEKYEDIQKTISIVIVDHEIEELKDFEDLNIKWQFRDNKTGRKILTDKFELVIIEIPKAKRIYEKDNSNIISQWMMFLDDPNNKEVLNIMEKNKDIKTAGHELKQVSGNDELRRIAELKEKYIRDEAAALDFAKQKGINEGINQGIEQEKIATAKNMLTRNMDINLIADITGLSLEKLTELKNNL